MRLYEIWVDLAPGAKDRELVTAIENWLNHHILNQTIEAFRISRRMFGFGFAPLGEFHITIETKNLTQLEDAFSLTAVRTGDVEQLHKEVYSRVTNYNAALYRDFPDPEDNR
ncbi:MAG: DUF6614 family protein [Fimbriimonadaceae bacterium]